MNVKPFQDRRTRVHHHRSLVHVDRRRRLGRGELAARRREDHRAKRRTLHAGGARVGARVRAGAGRHHQHPRPQGQQGADHASSSGAAATAAKNAGDTAKADELNAQRTTVMNGSFLRASLFTSVLSFGVCLFAIGVGLTLLVIGWALAEGGQPEGRGCGRRGRYSLIASRKVGGAMGRHPPSCIQDPEGRRRAPFYSGEGERPFRAPLRPPAGGQRRGTPTPGAPRRPSHPVGLGAVLQPRRPHREFAPGGPGAARTPDRSPGSGQ